MSGGVLCSASKAAQQDTEEKMTRPVLISKSAAAAVLGLVVCLILRAVSPEGSFALVSAAYADDDDSGGDDDDDGGTARSQSDDLDDGAAPPRGQNSQRATVRRAQIRSAPLPTVAPAEILVTGLSDGDLAVLLAEGYEVNDRQALATVATSVTRLAVPVGQQLVAARARVRLLPSGETADFNHFYRTEQSDQGNIGQEACNHENCAALDMVDWPRNRLSDPGCRVMTKVGLIDTGVNVGHEILAGARLSVVRLADQSLVASKAVHGTAIASLLVGAPDSRVPGLVPEAEVIAVDVFSDVAGDERADAATLVRALDVLATQQVRVINLSLAGPPNTVLHEVLDTLTVAGGPDTVIIAAAGNGGPTADPAWPAAHPGVLAVTAADLRERIYRQAQRGAHIDLAAPGVNLMAATSIKGARAKSGTSFAAPFVTAAAAILVSRQPTAPAARTAERLRGMARDLGATGPDDVFGHGLLSLAGLCGPVTDIAE